MALTEKHVEESQAYYALHKWHPHFIKKLIARINCFYEFKPVILTLPQHWFSSKLISANSMISLLFYKFPITWDHLNIYQPNRNLSHLTFKTPKVLAPPPHFPCTWDLLAGPIWVDIFFRYVSWQILEVS